MTQEEKAQAYDEAIKFAKIYHNSGDEDMKTMCETMFPELKESEGERIRKALINHFRCVAKNGDTVWTNLDYDKVIAWLEKQGEPADKIKPKFKVGDKIVSAFNTPYYITKVCDRYYLTDVGRIIMFNAQDNFELAEQKPAWSEDDETTKNNISHIIRQYDKISKRENKPCWYIGDCLLWMQNIKGRVLPQPKQEWSEEDIATISRVISIVKWAAYSDHSHPILNDKGATELIERLNSIKERYT